MYTSQELALQRSNGQFCLRREYVFILRNIRITL